MKRMMLVFVLLGLAVSGGFQRAQAAEKGSRDSRELSTGAMPDEKVTNGYDLKPQALLDLQQLQKKYVDLATAIPQEKYTWRPGEGVRSVSEVFLHVSQANYFFLSLLGVERPAGTDAKDFEKSTTDKPKIIDQINKSFAFTEAEVGKMTNADLAKALPKLGPDANEGDVVYLLVTHAHEHLGQSIAYARTNGVVPPWTAEAAAKKGGQQNPD
jgi:uncharacterized damage-inducible protein DinB